MSDYQSSKNNPVFYFETNKFDKENYRSYYFTDPVKIIRLHKACDMTDFFAEMAELSKKYHLAGFFSYELGYLLEPAFRNSADSEFPYALFCAYEKPAIFDHMQSKFISGNFQAPAGGDYTLSNLKLNVTEDEYRKNIETVRDYIRKGDIYQANYTIRYGFDFSGSPFGLYNDLKLKQQVAYNVYAEFDGYNVLSITPELFYRKQGFDITVKPMKGTWKRGRNNSEDELFGNALASDSKNQSENVMIVDLLRNDIGKVSEGGSVHATKLYEVEKYNTLFQMTSTVRSVLEKNLSLYDLIKGIFPSGSITGAPKIRCMEIIRELEKDERKVYTGSIGFFEPTGDSVFNVAIRTIILKDGKGEMGVGGGIVYDSTPEDEFRECRLKADFLIRKPKPEFSIIETILFNKNFERLDLHVKRMEGSAKYFDFAFDKELLHQKLNDLLKTLDHEKYKIRILLSRTGGITISHTKYEHAAYDKITFSNLRTDSNDKFLFHKTTNRDLYNAEFLRVRNAGHLDVVFFNEKNELTEGCITNIFVKLNGEIFTPPVECGLLNGIIRETLLADGSVKEKIILPDDLKNAEAFFVSNSIMGFREVELVI